MRLRLRLTMAEADQADQAVNPDQAGQLNLPLPANWDDYAGQARQAGQKPGAADQAGQQRWPHRPQLP